MTDFNAIEKTTKIAFFPFFLLKASFRIQKSTFAAKFSPMSGLEVILLAHVHCPGRARASLFQEYLRWSFTGRTFVTNESQRISQLLLGECAYSLSFTVEIKSCILSVYNQTWSRPFNHRSHSKRI